MWLPFVQVCWASCDILECRQFCPWAGIGTGTYLFYYKIQRYPNTPSWQNTLSQLCPWAGIGTGTYFFLDKIQRYPPSWQSALKIYHGVLPHVSFAFFSDFSLMIFQGSEKSVQLQLAPTLRHQVYFLHFQIHFIRCNIFARTNMRWHMRIQNWKNWASLKVVKRFFINPNVAQELVAFSSLTAIELFIFDFTMIGFRVPEGQYLTN